MVIKGGSLWTCKTCNLAFRFPVLSKHELDMLYKSSNDQSWITLFEERHDWKIANTWLKSNIPKKSSIIDIGCFDGCFLENLVNEYTCFGIEPHSAASFKAKNKGIKIIGEDFFSKEPLSYQVDCITAFDVIEHFHNPNLFLENCFKLIKPNGYLIISTGNFQAPTFQFMGSTYWYSAIPEHISFISPQWFNEAIKNINFKIIKTEKFSYKEESILTSYKEAFKNILYRISPSIFALLRQAGIGKTDVSTHKELTYYPPGWMTAKDHFLTILQKI